MTLTIVMTEQTPKLSLSLASAVSHLSPASDGTPAKGNLLPLYATLPGDILTPVIAYLRLTNGATTGESFLMESVVRGETGGRWSYVGASKC